LRHLPDTPLGVRYKNALKRVREISNWGAPPDKDRPTAKGAAFCLHSGTVAAQVAEVAVEDGALKVLRVWAAVDPGFAVNPDGARAQIQGAIVMGLSSVFHEKITFHEGLAAERNFHQYPLLSIAETPDIHVELLTSSDTPSGMGEVGVGPIAAAVGNALFALTGKRVRELPFPSLLSA
jgi:isoquinoline 1-oxidoreductase beta subunit